MKGGAISGFKLKANDFDKIGAMIKSANMPTLFVMEGGYDVEELGSNTLNVLLVFDDTTVYKNQNSRRTASVSDFLEPEFRGV